MAWCSVLFKDRKKLKEVVVEILYRTLKAESATLALSMENHPKVFEIVQMRRNDKRHYHAYYDLDAGSLEIDTLTHDDLIS